MMSEKKSAVIEVTMADLPLCCPPKDAVIWNMHPRVYLPIEEESLVVCPYCSATYRLKAGV